MLRLEASVGSGPNSLGFWINEGCSISPLCDISTCAALDPESQAPGRVPSSLACEKLWCQCEVQASRECAFPHQELFELLRRNTLWDMVKGGL